MRATARHGSHGNGATLALAGTLTGTPQAHGSQFPGYVQFTASTAELSDDQVGADVQTIEYYVTKDADLSSHDTGILVRTESRIGLLAQPHRFLRRSRS